MLKRSDLLTGILNERRTLRAFSINNNIITIRARNINASFEFLIKINLLNSR